MKIGVNGGEGFPIYEIHKSWNDTNIEVDQEKLERWKKSFEQFSSVQQEIVEEMEKQGFGDQVWSNGIWNGYHIYE